MSDKARHPERASPGHAVDTAGHLAVTSFPTAVESETVQAVLDRLSGTSFGVSDLLVVLDGNGRYRGVAEPVRLLRVSPMSQVSELARTDWPQVAPNTDQEHAVQIAAGAKAAALPVVAADGRPIGIIPPVVLLDVLAREHREDMHRFAGILKERAGSRHALEDPPGRRAVRRLPWLLVGLALSAAATGVMARFETALQANVTIAFFIPALVYLTDAIGTQTEAIAIRGLSARRKPLPRILLLELMTGGMIGLVLAIVAFAGVWLVFGDALLGLGVAISLLIAGTLASSLGLVLPWMLAKVRIDPAFGTGPVATIIQDVLTIMVYFAVITTLLAVPV
jgi:magnesium transporter